MGRLVKANPTTEASKGQTTVVGTGVHGRLVRTGDVQRTSPAGNTAKQPTIYQQALDAATERANELDKLTTPSASRKERANEADKSTAPSASRQEKNQSFGKRVLKAAGSGLVSEGANLANLGGVVADKRGGTEMSGVYRRQAETLDKQIAALEKTLQDPTMTAQDIKETNDALAIARSERAKYGKVIESGEKAGKSLYETADKGYSLAQKLSDESLSGTKGIQKGVLKVIPAATQIAAQTAERMIAPGLDMAGRAASVAGANAADYRHKAGAQYDAEKASLRATVAALGVAAGGALSKGVNASGVKLLRAVGAQNRVLPNILLGGTSAVGYAAGETGASELSRAMTDENYTPDWNAIGDTALTAFAFGAVTSAINAAAITGRNKRYMNELNDAAKERYDYAKRIIEDPRATAEQKAAGAQSVMDAVDKMRYTLDDLQVVGAQKEVDTMREFLLSIYGEMLPYTNVNAGGIGTGTSAIAPTAPGGGITPVRPAEAANPAPEIAPSAPISPRAPGAAAVQQPVTAPETAQQQVTSRLENAAAPAIVAPEAAPQQVSSGQNLPSTEESALDAGGRVPLDQYATPENADQISRQINDGTLAVDAQNKLYRVDENEHIDRRDSVSVGDRKVNAFQFDHPELHQYFADAAADLAEEMSFAQPGGELVRRTSREAGDDEYIRTKRGVSERVARLLDDEGVRYEDIDRSIGAIIHNHGQENFAAAKRVELLLDEMLTNGYTDIHGRYVAPNEAYIAAKRAIPGAAEETAQTREELPIYDMPNAENGGIYEQNEPSDRGAEPAQTEGQRADAVAAQDNLYGGDRGRGTAEPGAGRTGKLRRQTEEDRRNRALIQQRRERAWQQPLTSAAALGVQGGASEETLHVLPESEWDEELRGFSDWARGKGVKRVTMVTGLMQVETENGAAQVRGVINRESGEMILCVDGRHSATEIGRHEVGHFITEEENVRAFMDAVRGGEGWQGIYDAYEERYASLTANYIGMTAEQRALYVWEEILEDAYAGLDSYGQQASRYHEQAVSAIENAAEAPTFARSEPEGQQLRAADEPRSRGPPERYSTYIDGEIDSKSAYKGIRAVAEMQPVAEVSGTEFGKGEKDLITQVTEFFDSIGNEVYNPQLGDIMLTRRGAKSDVAHGIGRKKAAAFAAVPDVLKKGRVIDYQVDWKGRNYDTAVVAAPITIAGEPYIAGVVLTRANSENRFYVHEVLTEKGTAPFKTGESPTKGVDTGGDVPSIFSLLDKVRDVKRNTPAGQETESGEVAEPRTLGEEITRQLTGGGTEKYSADDAADKYLAPISDRNIKEKKKGISLDEALEALDAQRGLSYRFYGSDNPMSRAGYAMFADDPDRAGAGYGGDDSRAFSVRDADLTNISDLRNKITEARHETDERMPWVLEDHSEVSDDDFADLFDPEDIVDSAGAYDDEDLTAWFWENVLEPNGVKGVKTYDGAIAFEPDIISRNIAAEVAFNKADAQERLSSGDAKPKQRFSMEEPIEETKTLIAMHNMTEEKLRRTLDLGAWPSPSIAIVKAKDGHSNYGEYSAIFPRETIDPQADSRNHVYGGDAWTPTHDNALVEREVNYAARRAFDSRIGELSSKFAGGIFRGNGTLGKIGLENETRWETGEIAEKLTNYPEVQAAYLQSKGESLEPVRRSKQFDRNYSNETIQRYLDSVGAQEVARLNVKLLTGGHLTEKEAAQAKKAIREAYAEEHANFLNRRPESKEKSIDYYMQNNVTPNRVESFVRSAEAFYESGGAGSETDEEATAAKMFEMIAPGGSWNDVLRTVKDWVQPQLDGLLGERGVYNGKDVVTDSGRRSFAETHWDYTAENIVKAMNMAADKGANMYGVTPETLVATATPEFRSVDEMHAGEDRLRTESQDAHDRALRDLGIELDRAVDDLMRTTKHRHSNTFEEEQALSGIIVEAAKGKRTASAVKAAFRKEGYTISDGHAASILRLIERAASIPTGYYEAKPKRVVPFTELVAVVAPDNAPADLLSEMREAGMNVVEYTAGDDADRLEKINGIKDVRFSAEDEDGGDAWSEELARMPQSVQEAVQRAKERRDEERKQGLQEFPNLDAYLSGKSARRVAERAEKLRNKSKDEFDGTEALKDLGVKIENSAGDYSNVKQLIENDRAAKAIRRETRKAIKRLGATPKEQNFALNIASGLYDESDIPPTLNRGKVEELADYYSAEQSMSSDFIRQRRAEINETLEEKMKDLFDERFEGEFTAKAPKKGIAPDSGFALYHRTPQRSMRAIFGWDRGQQINEAIFEPVYTNEQERKRFVNRMHDEVRTFKDKDGKESTLTERERALTQLAIEGKAVDEMVGKSEFKQQIIHAAENLLNGAEMKEAAQEFGLHGKEERELAQRYADWLRAKEEINGGDVDRVKIENAAAEYSRLYDKFYAAINDFLVAHGYEPIGFIKGYAPHFQPEAESTKLESALKAIGVDLGAEVGKLPASIAGLTKSFKPNKRYNPFFQHRRGDGTEYDAQKGFEKYVDYLSDVLYHTDDIMRTRAAAKYFRKKYAPDEISAQIEQAENLKYAPPEEKELFLKTNGIIDRGAHLSYEGMNEAMEKYTESLFDDVQHTTKYGDLVTWLDDYANKLAGKQLFNDRSMEREVGRTSLNAGRKMVNLFARANVAGNLSSALNQTAQLPMIAGELGPKYVTQALGDIIKGETKGDFAERSDFLTEKHGIDYLTSKKGDKVMEVLFWPLERMDYLISSIAVRGKYRKELSEGKSEEEALRAADRWGRDMMGSRSKGTAPLTFQSKNLVSQMVNLFQVEALNSWEHVTQDLFGPGLREMEAKLGKKEAARRLAGTIIGTLLGAFLLNRLDEELYGGTPAQFDVLGLLTGFLASGNGLSTNEQLGVWIDDVWQKMTGERLFGTDEDAGNDQFNLAAAAEDTLYNVSSDIPYVRNVSGILGLGDQTLPMPDLYGTASGIGGAVSKAASGDYDSAADFWGEVGKQIMGLAGDTLPGGRQAEKTAQGTETLLRGGTYSGYGDNAKLQYPVTPSFSTVLQSTMFGRNALSESRDYYAAGMGALSVKQTQVYRELVEMGADQQTVYDAIQGWRKIDKDKSLSDGEREAERYQLVSKLPLTNEQKVKLHDELANSSKGYAAAQEAEQQGISMSTYAEYKDATAGLTADKDKNGNSISGSKKQKVIEEINKMPVKAHQKDWLYLQEGYSQKDLKKMPWNQ